jgi:hypothetical protein
MDTLICQSLRLDSLYGTLDSFHFLHLGSAFESPLRNQVAPNRPNHNRHKITPPEPLAFLTYQRFI